MTEDCALPDAHYRHESVLQRSYDVGIHIADMEQYMEIILVGKPQPAPQ